MTRHMSVVDTMFDAMDLEKRFTLPYLRPPKMKFSIWSIIKDSIGKDLTKMSIPVYFNEPLSMLQKISECMEYESLLEEASESDDPAFRMAKVTAFVAS